MTASSTDGPGIAGVDAGNVYEELFELSDERADLAEYFRRGIARSGHRVARSVGHMGRGSAQVLSTGGVGGCVV